MFPRLAQPYEKLSLMRMPESNRYGLTACFIVLTLLQSLFLSCSLRYDNNNKVIHLSITNLKSFSLVVDGVVDLVQAALENLTCNSIRTGTGVSGNKRPKEGITQRLIITVII